MEEVESPASSRRAAPSGVSPASPAGKRKQQYLMALPYNRLQRMAKARRMANVCQKRDKLVGHIMAHRIVEDSGSDGGDGGGGAGYGGDESDEEAADVDEEVGDEVVGDEVVSVLLRSLACCCAGVACFLRTTVDVENARVRAAGGVRRLTGRRGSCLRHQGLRVER